MVDEAPLTEEAAPDANPSSLRRLILAQAHEPGGAAVLLFTSGTFEVSFGVDPPRLDGRTGHEHRAARSVRPWTAGHSTALSRSPLLACNYHDIPRENRGAVELRLRRVVRFGASFDPDQSPNRSGTSGPRIFVGFYDGFRDAGLFGADLCHRLGIRAYFFPIFRPGEKPGSGELTDDDLAQVAAVHEIGFHTSSHLLAREVNEDNVVEEVLGPVRQIEAITGVRPRIAAWRGGTRFDPGLLGDRQLRDLGLRHLVSNWSVERIPPDAG